MVDVSDPFFHGGTGTSGVISSVGAISVLVANLLLKMNLPAVLATI